MFVVILFTRFYLINLSAQNLVNMNWMVSKKPRIVIRGVIEQHDIGLLKFDKDTGKAILDYALITEIILGSKYFQDRVGLFLLTHNRSMNKTWFKRKLGNGRGEEVARSWLVYSPSNDLHFVSVVFSISGQTIISHWCR